MRTHFIDRFVEIVGDLNTLAVFLQHREQLFGVGFQLARSDKDALPSRRLTTLLHWFHHRQAEADQLLK